MGSKSSSTNNQSTKTTNNAYDQSATNGEGLQILDSIVIDPSDKTTAKALDTHRETFAALMEKDNFALSSLLGLAKDLLKLTDKKSASIDSFAKYQLDTAIRLMEQDKARGVKTIELAAQVSTRSLDLVDKNTAHALELVADVKTGEFQDSLQTLGALVLLFGLGALWITTRNN